MTLSLCALSKNPTSLQTNECYRKPLEKARTRTTFVKGRQGSTHPWPSSLGGVPRLPEVLKIPRTEYDLYGGVRSYYPMNDAHRDESSETSNNPGTDPDISLNVNGRQPLTGEPRSVCLLNGGSSVSSTASYSKDEETKLREPPHNTADWPSESYRRSATQVDSILSTAATGVTYHPAHSGGPNDGVALVREETGVP